MPIKVSVQGCPGYDSGPLAATEPSPPEFDKGTAQVGASQSPLCSLSLGVSALAHDLQGDRAAPFCPTQGGQHYLSSLPQSRSQAHTKSKQAKRVLGGWARKTAPIGTHWALTVLVRVPGRSVGSFCDPHNDPETQLQLPPPFVHEEMMAQRDERTCPEVTQPVGGRAWMAIQRSGGPHSPALSPRGHLYVPRENLNYCFV